MNDIALYSASGQYLDHVSASQVEHMRAHDMIVRIIRSGIGKASRIRRVIRRPLAGEGSVHTLSSLSGTKYSYNEQLESGCRAWSLMGSSDLAKHQGIGAPLSPLSPLSPLCARS